MYSTYYPTNWAITILGSGSWVLGTGTVMGIFAEMLGPRMAPNAINLRTLELETAKRDPGRLLMPKRKGKCAAIAIDLPYLQVSAVPELVS